jgi:ubiquinone/menaquinone biosynthesis C-methylase UbiE
MGIYERFIFPWILEQLDGPEITALRAQCIGEAAGDVLEIGLGTGKTLPHYSPKVISLTAVEPNLGMKSRLDRRIAEASFPVDVQIGTGESLPFEDQRFDSVCVSLVLCSARDPLQVVREIRRVLKPGGTFHFFEHVASTDEATRRWQNRLNGIQRWIGCGCHLNRPTSETIVSAGMKIESLDRRISKEMPIAPSLFPLIVGTARKV